MKFQKLLAASAAALVLAACGDSSGPTGDTLEDEEIDEISQEVVGAVLGDALFGAIFGGGFTGPQANPPVDFDYDETVTEPCEAGGNTSVHVQLSGTVDSETGDGDIEIDVTADPNDCGIVTESENTFTINGDPNIRLTGDFSFADGQPQGTQTWSYAGGFTWESEDGRSGGCEIDIEIQFSLNSASAEGTVCGRSYDASVTVQD